MCHYVHVSEDERAVCGPEGVGMCMYFPDIGTHTCRYFCSNTWTYLLYVSLSACIFVRNTCTYCAGYGGFCAGFLRRFLRGFCAGFCAVASQSARLHCSRIAVASPSHRRIASAPHRVAARNAGDLQTSLESHLPVVQPTLCGRSGAYGRSDDEDTCRSHGRMVVTR